MLSRCVWAQTDHMPMRHYHDEKWGVPLHADDKLFEFLCLEGAQAGLSWRTVLDKRPCYRELFHDFAIADVARMSDAALNACLQNPGIIRNRNKVYTFRKNARLVQEIVAEAGSLDAYLWAFVDGRPVINHWRNAQDVPATTPASEAMSKALYKRGLRFVGPTICYSLMQATGMVNDHLVSCFRHPDAAG